ncbi:hypothetical protein ACI3QN_12705, partial [Propionibacterium freudenreichii]|uniref:hypothetical protein n=1 Tax=Propionibacterium freudenreichii TaxID=1744 RepID=UPI003852A20C
ITEYTGNTFIKIITNNILTSLSTNIYQNINSIVDQSTVLVGDLQSLKRYNIELNDPDVEEEGDVVEHYTQQYELIPGQGYLILE